MVVASTFCCVQCRLLQPPTLTCVECAAPLTAPVELVHELLHYRDMRFGSDRRDWSTITAFLAGSSLALPVLVPIALPVLAPIALGSVLALGIHRARRALRKRAIVGIDMPAAAAAPGSTTLFGVARRFRSTVTSIFDGAQVLLEHAMVKDPDGAVLIRRSEAAPFLLDVEGGGPVLITGIARVTTPNVLARRLHVRRDDPHLGRMGVPVDLGVAGDLEIASVSADGSNLAVTGVLEEEAVVELAFHRDGGRIPVMRGRVGAPVLVEDRRLIGAAF